MTREIGQCISRVILSGTVPASGFASGCAEFLVLLGFGSAGQEGFWRAHGIRALTGEVTWVESLERVATYASGTAKGIAI